MKNRLKSFLLLIIAIVAMGASSSNPITIYFIGDSTMADYDVTVYTGDTEQRGWGQMFRQFLVGGIQFVNAAKNGRSSKSFYSGSDSLWAGVRNKLKAGDYVFIQFGHNDEKDGGVSGPGGIGTAPWGEYQGFLRKYVNEARKLGAIPILVTPIVRHYFSGTTITRTGAHDLGTTLDDSILNYPRAMKSVARELTVPLIDHTSLTKALVESYGPTDSKTIIYINADDTHLKAMGGTLFARLAVQEMIRQNILTTYLNPSPDLIVSPTSIDFGNCYVSTYVGRSISVSAMDLSPASGTIAVKATDGFLVSGTESGTYADSVILSYTNGNLSATNVYIHFQPSNAQTYTGEITVSNPSGNPKKISLTGVALSLTGGVPASINFPLTVDANPVITGPLISLGESWSGMSVKNYAVPSSSVTWPVGVTGGITQRNTIIGDTWPAGEVDIVTTRYIQFGIQPAAQATFTIDSIGMYAGAAGGSGMRFRVMAAKKADFSDAVTLENRISNGSNTMYALSYKPVLQVDDTEFYYLRFYPWYSSSASMKYLCLQNLTISGKVSKKGGATLLKAKLYAPSASIYNVDTSNVQLIWRTSSGANSYKVYLGADSLSLNLTKTNSASDTSFVMASLSAGTKYYWRVDAANDSAEAKGISQSFSTKERTPGKSFNLFPFNGSSKIDTINTKLKWQRGNYTHWNKVFYGTDSINLTSVLNNVMVDSLIIPALISNTKYFWKVNTLNGTSETNGDIFSFKTKSRDIISSVFLNAMDQARLEVYPNPSKDIFYLRNIEMSDHSFIEVYNQTGLMLHKIEIRDNPLSIDLSDLSNGVYILKIISGQQLETRLLIKY